MTSTSTSTSTDKAADAGDALFSELPSADLASRIADQVLRAISDNRLTPGQKVAEARLAREMGTSRAPVREALRLLESQGLIVSHPRRGFFVHSYDADELDDIYDLRECLELHAAESAVERVTTADIDRLAAQVNLLKQLAQDGQMQEQIAQDYEFHRMLCALGGNMRVLRLFDQISTQLRAGIALLGRVYDDPRELARSHDVLIDALRNKDAAGLRRELKEHLEEARFQVVALFRKDNE
ncbi:MAG: GntR family transcriptional regulator [Paracoccaceae bacterium]